eukprot:COSAG01_NODE_1848_length_9066_cov_6.023754_3_plen_44_part_00
MYRATIDDDQYGEVDLESALQRMGEKATEGRQRAPDTNVSGDY